MRGWIRVATPIARPRDNCLSIFMTLLFGWSAGHTGRGSHADDHIERSPSVPATYRTVLRVPTARADDNRVFRAVPNRRRHRKLRFSLTEQEHTSAHTRNRTRPDIPTTEPTPHERLRPFTLITAHSVPMESQGFLTPTLQTLAQVAPEPVSPVPPPDRTEA